MYTPNFVKLEFGLPQIDFFLKINGPNAWETLVGLPVLKFLRYLIICHFWPLSTTLENLVPDHSADSRAIRPQDFNFYL